MQNITSTTVKNFKFKNPKWRTAAILKTVKLQYLCRYLTVFDKIWHDDACWSPAPDVKFTFFNFRPSYMADSRNIEYRETA